MTRASFPRAARLLAAEDFSRALRTRAQRGRYLWIYRNAPAATAAAEPPRPRLGLMVAKRNARRAVLRNAIKRRLREQFRLRQQGLPPLHYVVRLSAVVQKADLPLLVDEWCRSLERDCRKQAEAAAP